MTQPFKADQAVNASAVSRPSHLFRSVLLRLSEAAWIWRARIRSRSDLAQFDDHILKDIGLSLADVYRETSKPFWRE